MDSTAYLLGVLGRVADPDLFDLVVERVGGAAREADYDLGYDTADDFFARRQGRTSESDKDARRRRWHEAAMRLFGRSGHEETEARLEAWRRSLPEPPDEEKTATRRKNIKKAVTGAIIAEMNRSES